MSFELLDVNASYAWIGFWRPCVTHGGWTRCAAEVPVSPSIAGHDLDVSLVFGVFGCDVPRGRHLRYPAPRRTEGQRAHALLTEDFESAIRPPPPPVGGLGALIALERPTSPEVAAAAAAASVDLHSASAARTAGAAR